MIIATMKVCLRKQTGYLRLTKRVFDHPIKSSSLIFICIITAIE